MRMGKLTLPRWGVLGREARDTARPSAAEKRRAHRVAASVTGQVGNANLVYLPSVFLVFPQL